MITKTETADTIHGIFWDVVNAKESLHGDHHLVSMAQVDLQNAMVELFKAYEKLTKWEELP